MALLFSFKNKYDEKQRKYGYNRLLHASTGASSVGAVSGISTIGTTFTVVGLPVFQLVLVEFCY